MDPARALLARHKPTDRPTSKLRWEGFLCLFNFPIPLSPSIIYTIVRKFFLISDFHPFCFCASFLLLEGNVL